MEKSVIFLLIVALTSAIVTVDAACVERDHAEGSNATETTVNKVKSFFEEVGCTFKPFTEVVKNKVSSGYNYLKTKIEEANSGNKTTTKTMDNHKGAKVENSNVNLKTNNEANSKSLDSDKIVFRDSDQFSGGGDTKADGNPSTNGPTNPNHQTTPNHQLTSGVDATSTLSTTSELDTTTGLTDELPVTTVVNLEDRIIFEAPDQCRKGEVRVDGQCRVQIQI